MPGVKVTKLVVCPLSDKCKVHYTRWPHCKPHVSQNNCIWPCANKNKPAGRSECVAVKRSKHDHV